MKIGFAYPKILKAEGDSKRTMGFKTSQMYAFTHLDVGHLGKVTLLGFSFFILVSAPVSCLSLEKESSV